MLSICGWICKHSESLAQKATCPPDDRLFYWLTRMYLQLLSRLSLRSDLVPDLIGLLSDFPNLSVHFLTDAIPRHALDVPLLSSLRLS